MESKTQAMVRFPSYVFSRTQQINHLLNGFGMIAARNKILGSGGIVRRRRTLCMSSLRHQQQL